MFYESSFNQPLSSWNVRRVTKMGYAFGSSPMKQDLSEWCVPLFDAPPTGFGNDNGTQPVWGTCPSSVPSESPSESPSSAPSNVPTAAPNVPTPAVPTPSSDAACYGLKIAVSVCAAIGAVVVV